jgi:hypothetical protein
MKAVHDACLVALGEHKSLVEKHQQFVAELAKRSACMPDYGFIQITGSTLKAACFGVDLESVCRVIGSNEHFSAVEYAFYGNLGTERHFLWAFYLVSNGALFHDSALTDRICDYNNPYVHEYLVAGLAAAFLKSPIVAPCP